MKYFFEHNVIRVVLVVVYGIILMLLTYAFVSFIYWLLPDDVQVSLDMDYDEVTLDCGSAEYVFEGPLTLTLPDYVSTSINLYGNDYMVNDHKVDAREGEVKTITSKRGAKLNIVSEGVIICSYDLGNCKNTINQQNEIKFSDDVAFVIKSTEPISISVVGEDFSLEGENLYSLYFPANKNFAISSGRWPIYLSYKTLLSMKSGFISDIEVIGTGKLTYFNTSQGKEYSLLNQKVNCSVFDDKAIMVDDATAKINGNHICFTGATNEVKIMEHAIKTDVISWAADNVYTIPSVILVVFGGAITLAVHSIKNETNSNR